MAETITVATSGTLGSGFATIIAQAADSLRGFSQPITFSSIAGISPMVVPTLNAAGTGTGRSHLENPWQCRRLHF